VCAPVEDPVEEPAVSPSDFMGAVRELYAEWLDMSHRLGDESLRGLPDFERAMDEVERHGLAPL
jgi:hypothetical protein